MNIGEEKITSYLNYQKTEISEKSTGKKHWEYCLKLLKDIDLKNFSWYFKYEIVVKP